MSAIAVPIAPAPMSAILSKRSGSAADMVGARSVIGQKSSVLMCRYRVGPSAVTVLKTLAGEQRSGKHGAEAGARVTEHRKRVAGAAQARPR